VAPYKQTQTCPSPNNSRKHISMATWHDRTQNPEDPLFTLTSGFPSIKYGCIIIRLKSFWNHPCSPSKHTPVVNSPYAIPVSNFNRIGSTN
jgi:hypothetical protein